jgi:hypothetical protein
LEVRLQPHGLPSNLFVIIYFLRIFLIFVRDEIPYFCKQPIDAYQGSRLRPRAWMTAGSLLLAGMQSLGRLELSGSVGCAFSV